MLRKTSSLGFGAFLLLTSCNLAPDYHRPDGKISQKYPADTGVNSQKGAYHVSDLGWEDFFTDPRLKKLIELTLANNRDLSGQLAAVIEARGQYQVQNAALFPQISAGGSAMYQGPSSMAGFSFSPGSGESISTLKFYQTSIGFSSYEIDLWGRIRNLSRNQKEATLNAAENLRNLWITTVSQLAETYIQWLADKQLLDLAERTYKTREGTMKLTQLNFDHGQTDALTLAQVASQLEQAQSDIAQQKRAVADDEHNLQLIVGAPLPKDLPPPAPMGQQTMIADLPAGLPSELLEQRPDIQAAEHTLIGANAMVGAARAAFFPKVTLTANEGTSSLQFRKLFSNMAQTWGVSPNINIPLLTWGQNSGNLRSAKARVTESVTQYQKTVQTAFKEVSDALTARETYKAQDQHMTNLVTQSQKAYDLAYMRFRAGIDDYLTTLVQERQLYTDRQSKIVVQAARFQNMVTLYRALGGGWSRKTSHPKESGQAPVKGHVKKTL